MSINTIFLWPSPSQNSLAMCDIDFVFRCPLSAPWFSQRLLVHVHSLSFPLLPCVTSMEESHLSLHFTFLFSTPSSGRSSKCARPVTITERRLLVYKSRDADTLRMMYECSSSSEEHGQLWLVPGDSCVCLLLLMSACWEIVAQLNQTLLLLHVANTCTKYQK